MFAVLKERSNLSRIPANLFREIHFRMKVASSNLYLVILKGTLEYVKYWTEINLNDDFFKIADSQ